MCMRLFTQSFSNLEFEFQIGALLHSNFSFRNPFPLFLSSVPPYNILSSTWIFVSFSQWLPVVPRGQKQPGALPSSASWQRPRPQTPAEHPDSLQPPGIRQDNNHVCYYIARQMLK